MLSVNANFLCCLQAESDYVLRSVLVASFSMYCTLSTMLKIKKSLFLIFYLRGEFAVKVDVMLLNRAQKINDSPVHGLRSYVHKLFVLAVNTSFRANFCETH